MTRPWEGAHLADETNRHPKTEGGQASMRSDSMSAQVGQEIAPRWQPWPIGGAHNLRKKHWASQIIPAKKATKALKETAPQ
jgi:hypothetical protein